MQHEALRLEALQVFCDVARCRSISQAAAANGVTQSAASQIVLHLEHRLGVQLIDRSTRPLQLTELGQVYYEGCRNLLEQYRELEASVRKAQIEIGAEVRVAAIYSVGLGDMGHFIERFVGQHPGARVHVDYLHPDRVYENVLAGTADFGLVSFPRKSRELNVLPWRDEPMVLVCPPHHPLAARHSIRPLDLAGERFIGFDKALVIRRKVDRYLREQGVTVEIVMEFDNIESIKKAIEISGGVALLPEPTIRREVQAGSLVAKPLNGSGLTRPLGILLNRHHKPTATVLRFIDLLRQPEGPDSPHFADWTGNGSRRRNGASRRSTRTSVS